MPRPQPWQTLFAHWLPARQPLAEAVAFAAMQRETAMLNADRQCSEDRHHADLLRWLAGRADDICGAVASPTGDLFGATACVPDWRVLPEPLDRLAAFVADGANQPARRREANSVVELYQRRESERAARLALAPPLIRLIGMLMLVPAKAAA
jgi:hypothetical protein